MPHYVIAPPAIPVVRVHGGGVFPVRRIFCVGQNYADHAREMGSDPSREQPFFFTKPADALVLDDADIPYPSATENLHHEVELVVALKSGGAHISSTDALTHVYGYAVGLDMTRRDMQAAAKKAGRPWDMSKGFDFSAPISALMPVSGGAHPASNAIELFVNDTVRQRSSLGNMIWSVPDIIASLSSLICLQAGDLIFTGTPEGVGAVVRGDVLQGKIEGVGHVRTRII